jgi:hypothetical protein
MFSTQKFSLPGTPRTISVEIDGISSRIGGFRSVKIVTIMATVVISFPCLLGRALSVALVLANGCGNGEHFGGYLLMTCLGAQRIVFIDCVR